MYGINNEQMYHWYKLDDTLFGAGVVTPSAFEIQKYQETPSFGLKPKFLFSFHGFFCGVLNNAVP